MKSFYSPIKYNFAKGRFQFILAIKCEDSSNDVLDYLDFWKLDFIVNSFNYQNRIVAVSYQSR